MPEPVKTPPYDKEKVENMDFTKIKYHRYNLEYWKKSHFFNPGKLRGHARS